MHGQPWVSGSTPCIFQFNQCLLTFGAYQAKIWTYHSGKLIFRKSASKGLHRSRFFFNKYDFLVLTLDDFLDKIS